MKISNFLSNFFFYSEEENYNFDLYDTPQVNIMENENDHPVSEVKNIFSDVKSNLEYLKIQYNTLINSDIVIRKFRLVANNTTYQAFIFYIDGMVNSDTINDFILSPLMLRNRSNTHRIKSEALKDSQIVSSILAQSTPKHNFDLETYIYESLLPQNSLKKVKEFKPLISDINSGNCALFVETLNTAFDIEVKGFKSRNIGQPSNEIVVRGSQEAFVEVIRTNTSLIRRMIHNENLVIENINVGNVSQTSTAICYMKNIANDNLVSEVKYRINNLNVDYLFSSGQLEQLIQDNGNISVPQIISTERPDRVANNLLCGRVAVLVDGSPYALVMPGILVDYLSSPEDSNLKHQFSNLLKVVRLISFFFALLLPAIYIAITNYHQELIPTELVFAIVASREAVPFPIIFEIFLMEISFELIREAGVRIPSVLGPTIGIVGALILGQAAVSASIVSPILIIIVAITGICSFAIPDFSLSFSIRLYRFIYILLACFAGLLGIGLGLFVQCAIITSLKSFGVNYLASSLEMNSSKNNNTYWVHPIWKRENRADYLKTKKPRIEKNISMKWKKLK